MMEKLKASRKSSIISLKAVLLRVIMNLEDSFKTYASLKAS